MGLGQYVYPRYAVHIASGQAVPIERLRARPLWYPAVGLNGLKVTGHVLYVSSALRETMEVALGLHTPLDWNAECVVEGGEDDINYLLTTPIRTTAYASVDKLIRAVFDHTRQALPPSKRKLLTEVGKAPSDVLLRRLEETLQKNYLHVLVPLWIGNLYQLFTDATEALMPVSPMNLDHSPRLCFVLISTDSLKDEKRGSPWLRQAAELMALPVSVQRTREVMQFFRELPSLEPLLNDEQLVSELLLTLHDVTGGWPDLCDRFFEMLTQLADVQALRARLIEIAIELRAAGGSRERLRTLFGLCFGRPTALPDLATLPPIDPPQSHSRYEPRAGSSGAVAAISLGAYEDLLQLVREPARFTWESHGRGYLDGLISWERGLAVPRSHLIELALHTYLDSEAGGAEPVSRPDVHVESGHSVTAMASSLPPGPKTVRWLHLSDFHFSDRHNKQGARYVLDSLCNTLSDMRARGRGADLIFVTGDIAQSGAEDEYRLAETHLARVCELLGLPRQAVHMVPGNHDVSRPRGFGLQRTLSSSEEALMYFQPSAERWHLKKMEAFSTFYDRFYRGAPNPPASPRQASPGLATAQAEIVRVRELDIGILPLNTAWFAQDDQDHGKLFVGEPLLRAGLERIERAQLRVALMHHPISDLSDYERRMIQDLLLERCHFVLRGHLHDNEASKLSSAYRQALVLAAGAGYQSRELYQNRALFVEVDVDPIKQSAVVRPYPIRYEATGHDRWTLDTSVFPKSYPTYLEALTLPLSLPSGR